MEDEFYKFDGFYLNGYIKNSTKIKISSSKINSVEKKGDSFIVNIKEIDYIPRALSTIIAYKFNAPERAIDCLVKELFGEKSSTVNNDPPCIKKSKLPLKEHQKRLVEHFRKNRGLIAIWSVGSGKTLGAVTAAECFLSDNPKGRVIVVTPTSLQANFKKELQQYNPAISLKRYEFYTLEGFSRADSKGEIDCKDVFLIIDEAHNIRTNIKVSKSGKVTGKRAMALNKCGALGSAKKILLLTATPIINKPYDIENLIALVDGRDPIEEKLWGSYSGKDDYYRCKISMYAPDPEGSKQFYPESKQHNVYIPMPSDYEAKYIELEKKIASETRTKKGDEAALGAFYTALRQASNKLDDTIDSPKIKWLEDFLDTHQKGKMVIFSHWLDAGLEYVKEVLRARNISFLHIDGSLNQEKRKVAVQKYNAGEIRVLLISKAGGEGLDLKETRYMILMDPGWNPATAEQVIGRGIRFKSHEKLPKEERFVDVYKLYLVKNIEVGKEDDKDKLEEIDYEYPEKLSADLYLRNISIEKQEMIDEMMEKLEPLSIEYCNGSSQKSPSKKKISLSKEIKLLYNIFKKFNPTKLQRDTFIQYVEYMNEESKENFLNKVLTSKKDYFLQFVDVDLERFEEEMFTGMEETREKHQDLYDAKTNPESKLFLYKSLLIRLKDLSKEERKTIYEKYFKINYKNFEKKSVEEKREDLYNAFSQFINSHNDLKGFINSLFDRKSEIQWSK